MSETLHIQYTQNAEWVIAQTGDYSGSYVMLRPEHNDVRNVVPYGTEPTEPTDENTIDLTVSKV